MNTVDSIERVRLRNFTVFQSLDLALSPGINVLIGENGTGKSHLLKALYASLRPFRAELDDPGSRNALGVALASSLSDVFRPERVGRLVRRQQGRAGCSVDLTLKTSEGRRAVGYKLSTQTSRRVDLSGRLWPLRVSSVYLPTREVMSFFPGFVHAWEQRELEFDATHYDLCRALGGAPLKRGVRAASVTALVEGLESQLGARVRIDNGRFYVKSVDGDIEAHLVAEGLRKLATIMYLILNGTLGETSIVLWDEPEANLNPRYVSVVARLLQGLAAAGVQVVLATHDYLLTQKLSLAAESGVEGTPPMLFHSLRRSDQGVVVESAPTLAELDHNPILDEFAKHYDEELVAALDGTSPMPEAG